MSTRFLSRLPLLILLGVCCSDAMGQAQATQAPVALSKEEAEKLLVKAPEAPYPAERRLLRAVKEELCTTAPENS